MNRIRRIGKNYRVIARLRSNKHNFRYRYTDLPRADRCKLLFYYSRRTDRTSALPTRRDRIITAALILHYGPIFRSDGKS